MTNSCGLDQCSSGCQDLFNTSNSSKYLLPSCDGHIHPRSYLSGRPRRGGHNLHVRDSHSHRALRTQPVRAIAFPTAAATSEGAGALRARRLATCPWPFAHYDQFSPFGTTSPTHLAKQPADDQTVSPSDTLANPWLSASNAAGQLGATWRQDSVQWPSCTSSCESPDRSPQQAHSSALQPQRSSGGSSPTTASLEEATAAMMLAASSSSASFTAYNMQQPSVGFYRRESASGMAPALTMVARPDHVSDAAGFNMNKSITKRMANATHYQQVYTRSMCAHLKTRQHAKRNSALTASMSMHIPAVPCSPAHASPHL